MAWYLYEWAYLLKKAMEHIKNHRFKNMVIDLNLVFAFFRVLYSGLNYVSEEKKTVSVS